MNELALLHPAAQVAVVIVVPLAVVAFYWVLFNR